ncbi:TPA: host cell division inhibitor Icd-like protein [Citrobacter freundii]|nr:host cell division inhibitor Icd-like protein [Citrobacter freundii]
MTGKTKAAMPGRQCNTALLKHRQITRLAAGGQTLHSPVLARSNYHQGFKIRAGVQNLRSPVWGCSNHDEAAASDLHNSIRVAQNLSRRNSHAQTKLGDMPSLNNRVRLTYGHCNPLKELDYNESLESAGNKHEKYSGSPEHQHCLGSAIIFRGCIKENQQRAVEVPTNNVESCNGSAFLLYEGNQQRTVLYRNPDLAYERVVPQSHEVNQAAKRYAESKTSLRGAVQCVETYEIFVGHSITESNPVQLSGSDLAFLRCRRLISPRIEVTINPALLSPSSLSDSISATTSCGTRTVKSCDFAFLLEVAITDSFDVWCVSVYAKKSYAQCLKCVSLECSFKSEGETHLTNSEARQCSNTNRASYHNVTEAYIMACIQHTQTRPKYQYRFLALSAIGRNVIHITATTEREAREQSPAGCVMVFAGRLPVREGQHA